MSGSTHQNANGLISVIRMAKRNITLEEQLKKSDRESQNIQRELEVANGAVLATQHLALNKSEEARFCCKQFEGAEEQLKLALEKVISV